MALQPHLLIFGHGYSADILATELVKQGWRITGTSRNAETRKHYERDGVTMIDFSTDDVATALTTATHVLISAPPSDAGDPALNSFRDVIQNAPQLQWIGYLSTTGVYGNHDGAWVDEATTPQPTHPRDIHRLQAEKDWFAFGESAQVPTHAFRIAGIYGPTRNAVAQLQQGHARAIYKEGQFFSRIHVADIANVVMASIATPQAGEVYNLCDDEPTGSHVPIQYAAELLGVDSPTIIPFEDAELPPPALAFYEANRRVKNTKIKAQLGVTLLYPTYKQGLQSLAKRAD